LLLKTRKREDEENRGKEKEENILNSLQKIMYIVEILI